MPNSERVALILTEAVVGPQVWQYGICDTMPDELYEETKLAAVAVLELAARAVDWPRLLFEAEWRHRELHRNAPAPDPTGYTPISRDVCGECLREALLSHGYSGYSQDWRVEPTAKRRAEHLDWPKIFAEAIRYRRPEYLERLRTRKRTLAAGKES